MTTAILIFAGLVLGIVVGALLFAWYCARQTKGR